MRSFAASGDPRSVHQIDLLYSLGSPKTGAMNEADQPLDLGSTRLGPVSAACGPMFPSYSAIPQIKKKTAAQTFSSLCRGRE